jgi:lipid-binding SYLF domain-containing protein
MLRTALLSKLSGITLLVLSGLSVQSAFADSYEGTIGVFESNETVAPFFDQSYGYAIFPSIGKGGIGVGGAYGKGQVYRNGRVTGIVSLSKLTIGFQLGGQVFSEVIFLKDERAYNEFTSGSYEFDATASAVAITAGAQAQVGTVGSSANASAGPATAAQVETGYTKGMAVFTHAIGGLMYEAAIGGQKFNFTPAEIKKTDADEA